MLSGPQNITAFFSNLGVDSWLARAMNSSRSSPIPEFNHFNRVKYLWHTFEYLERPAIMESPSKKVFLNCFFKRR